MIGPVICDTTAQDPTSGKRHLLGIFSNINALHLPSQQTFFFYMRLADGEGKYEFEARWFNRVTGKAVIAGQGRMEMSDRSVQIEAVLQITVELPNAGVFELQIWANNRFLGMIPVQVTDATKG